MERGRSVDGSGRSRPVVSLGEVACARRVRSRLGDRVERSACGRLARRPPRRRSSPPAPDSRTSRARAVKEPKLTFRSASLAGARPRGRDRRPSPGTSRTRTASASTSRASAGPSRSRGRASRRAICRAASQIRANGDRAGDVPGARPVPGRARDRLAPRERQGRAPLPARRDARRPDPARDPRPAALARGPAAAPVAAALRARGASRSGASAFTEIALDVRLRVRNPNAFALPVGQARLRARHRRRAGRARRGRRARRRGGRDERGRRDPGAARRRSPPGAPPPTSPAAARCRWISAGTAERRRDPAPARPPGTGPRARGSGASRPRTPATRRVPGSPDGAPAARHVTMSWTGGSRVDGVGRGDVGGRRVRSTSSTARSCGALRQLAIAASEGRAGGDPRRAAPPRTPTLRATSSRRGALDGGGRLPGRSASTPGSTARILDRHRGRAPATADARRLFAGGAAELVRDARRAHAHRRPEARPLLDRPREPAHASPRRGRGGGVALTPIPRHAPRPRRRRRPRCDHRRPASRRGR